MSYWDSRTDIESFVGKTFEKVEKVADDLLRFTTVEGEVFEMMHYQDCCEYVYIEDICGDLSDLVGSPILVAYESTNANEPPRSEWTESYTWTFYTLRTMKGTVTLRWYGESNGYYSESVDIRKVD